MKTLFPILILLLAVPVLGQRSVGDLSPAHAAALEEYIAAQKGITFRQEYDFSDEDRKWLQESFGKGFKPGYAVGDFNKDKIADFAVLLYRAGKSEPSGATGEQHTPDYPLRLVVFNGGSSGFRVAHVEDLMGPHAAFVHFDKTLYYGIFESDADTFFLVPKGKGYIAQYEDPR